MKATILDLRRKMSQVIQALDRNETVTIFYRGKKKGILTPVGKNNSTRDVRKHPAFGMYKDRENTLGVNEYVRKLRKGRVHGF